MLILKKMKLQRQEAEMKRQIKEFGLKEQSKEQQENEAGIFI